jgi:undecaprenyl diphosphate synthase
MVTANVPMHLGLIIDGNRRWARQRGLPSFEGHRRGYDKLAEVGEWCVQRGITTLTAFVFSTENWQRSAEEVNYLMGLLRHALTAEVVQFQGRGIRLRVIGRRDGLPDEVSRAADEAERRTADGERGTLYLALNYGGRAEIVDAVRRIVTAGVAAPSVTDEVIRQHLYAPEAPDPDLIIRTSGEQRTSGFLLWQSAYSELYFIEKYWPDFTAADLDAAIVWYAGRQRRFGR